MPMRLFRVGVRFVFVSWHPHRGACVAGNRRKYPHLQFDLITLGRRPPRDGVAYPLQENAAHFFSKYYLATTLAASSPHTPTLPLHRQVASQLWMLLAYAADSLAVAAQGLIGDRVGAGMVPGAREVAGRVRRF